MKFRKKTTIMVCAIALMLLPIGTASASSLSEAEETKKQLESDLAATQAMIDELKDKKSGIEDAVAQLDAQLTDISVKINETQAALDAKTLEIEDTQALLAQAEADVETQNVSMQKRIQYMYENGGQLSYLEAFFRSGSIAEFLNQVEYIRQIEEYDREMLVQYEESVAAVRDSKALLEQEYADLETLKAQSQEQQAAVELLVAAKEDELAAAAGDLSEEQEKADAVQAEIDAQNEIIAQIQEEERRRKEEEANGSSSEQNPGAEYSGGAFVWPCPSSTRVTSDFGNRLSPTAGASSNHKGIDIGASYGADIVAAADGKVTFAGYSKSSGNYVMISHGGGLYTVYCHASSLLVSAGETVNAGQTIAKVGSTGISTGNHLHFGVSLNGSYVSPWNYLSK